MRWRVTSPNSNSEESSLPMEIHLEPERVAFTAVLVLLMLLQVVFSVRAWNHYRLLSRLGANTLQMQLVGIDWYVEFSRLYVVIGGVVIGLLSFVATSTPRSTFSVVAS